MKAKVELELKPFTVPNFVILTNNGDGEGSSVPLSALDSETLDDMCREFRKAVFTKANKQQPPIEARYCLKCERSV